MLHTSACEVLGITHPVVQAGMASYGTNAELVAAVSAAGGLGTLGCLHRTAEDAVAQIRRIRARTDRPFAVNFVLDHCDEAAFTACLDERVPVFTFFRSDPAAAIGRAHAAGAKTIYQATSVAEAQRAVDAGVDVLIAQGTEAGGHMGPIPLFSLLPDVVVVAAGRPVLAAGGIVDGSGLAAALCLGAAGVLMGTRFLATPEAPANDTHKRALLAAEPESTIASTIFDIIWGDAWPGTQTRALRNRLSARWEGREVELAAARDAAAQALQRAEADADPDEMINLAGMGVGRIRELKPAGQIVHDVAAEAAAILQRLGAAAGAPAL